MHMDVYHMRGIWGLLFYNYFLAEVSLLPPENPIFEYISYRKSRFPHWLVSLGVSHFRLRVKISTNKKCNVFLIDNAPCVTIFSFGDSFIGLLSETWRRSPISATHRNPIDNDRARSDFRANSQHLLSMCCALSKLKRIYVLFSKTMTEAQILKLKMLQSSRVGRWVLQVNALCKLHNKQVIQ